MADESNVKAVQVKLVLLGEAAVGKSSLVLRFCSNDFNENTSPTIGAAFLTQKCRLENRVVKFEIWDTAGQERFHSLAPMYYRNAAAAVVVYDITKAASLEKAKAWVKELQRQANPNIVICLVGNKSDLVSEPSKPVSSESTEPQTETEGNDEEEAEPVSAVEDENPRQVSREEAEAYAKEANLLFFEASAKTGSNISELFTEIAKTIPIETPAAAGAKAAAGTAGSRRSGGEQVNLGEGQQTKKAGCC